MGFWKQKMIDEGCRTAEELDRKLREYEEKIVKEEGKVAMYCPGCGYAWSRKDMQLKECVHGCGYRRVFNGDEHA